MILEQFRVMIQATVKTTDPDGPALERMTYPLRMIYDTGVNLSMSTTTKKEDGVEIKRTTCIVTIQLVNPTYRSIGKAINRITKAAQRANAQLEFDFDFELDEDELDKEFGDAEAEIEVAVVGGDVDGDGEEAGTRL